MYSDTGVCLDPGAADRLSRLESIIEESPLVVYACKPDGDFGATYVSNGARLLWGYDPDEFLKESDFWLRRIHPQDRARILDGLRDLPAQGSRIHEYRFQTSTGEYHWTLDASRMVRDSAGNPLEIVGCRNDISAANVAKRSQRESRDLLSFQSTSDWQMLIRVEPTGQLVLDAMNPALRSVVTPLAPAGAVLLEQDFEEACALIGLSGEQIEFRLALLRQVIAEKKSTHYETLDFPKGFAVEVTVSPVLDESGRCIYVSWIGRNVTTRNAVMVALDREARDLREAQRIAKVGSWYRTANMEQAVWSEEMYRIYGLDPNGPPPSVEDLRQFFSPEAWERRNAEMARVLREGRRCELTLELCRADGQKRWIVAVVEAERDQFGEVLGVRGTAHDITEQREMELALQSREKQLTLIFNSTTDAKALVRVTAEGAYRIEAVNGAYADLVTTAFGASGLQLEGQDRSELLAGFGFPEEAIRKELPLYDRAVREGCAVHAEVTFPAADGSTLFMEVSVRPIQGSDGRCTHVLWSGRDITESKKKEIELRTSLREKEILVREVHHRVKNNLQIISSLLHFQAKNTTDPGAIAVFRQGQDRLRSMMLVHEKLYRSSSLAAIDFAEYLQSLTTEIARSHELQARGIQLHVQCEGLLLPAETVLPCGMILSELITNAFKHGFPAGRTGTISVRVALRAATVKIEVEDDGIGVPVDARDGPNGFGADLIRSLTEQIGGSITYSYEPGTMVAISIPYDILSHSI